MTAKKKIVETLSEDQKRILQKASPTVNRQVGGDFTIIEAEQRKQVLFRAAPHARQPSILWTTDRKLKKKFYVRRFLEFHDQFECEFADRASRVLGEVDQELDLAGENDIFFNVKCEESTLFFSLPRRALTSRNGQMIVRIPKEVYEVQRRAQLRYRSNRIDEFKIESDFFRDWTDRIRVLDISSGGIGMQLDCESESEADAVQFERDARFPFRLDLGLIAIQGEGEIRYLRRAEDEETGEPVVRVGLRFVGLSQDLVEAIQILVMEKSYFRLREMFTD
jgi:hypothetical protein